MVWQFGSLCLCKDYVLFSDSSSVQSVRSEDDDEFVVLQKPIGEIRRAFGEMRDRWEPIFKDFESILNFEFRSSLNFESILNFDISTFQALRHVWIWSKTSGNNLLARGLIQVGGYQAIIPVRRLKRVWLVSSWNWTEDFHTPLYTMPQLLSILISGRVMKTRKMTRVNCQTSKSRLCKWIIK